jgi:hypothetical protein
VGTEHAHWQGHLHGYINTLRAILEYALATNDARLKAFVRDGYEWTRQAGFARAGYVGDGQGCGLARVIGLAIKLTDAGIGDYWEDVDQYIRNHGTEMQIMPDDLDALREMVKGKPLPESKPGVKVEGAIEAAVGGFGGQPTKNHFALCCSTHGNMGLFYAWDGIVRYADGTARVNLLLNRASPWLDVDSYLPFEGKAIIKNKTAQEIFVRIPLWVDSRAVTATRNGEAVTPAWAGRSLRFQNMQPQDIVVVEFPMVETTETWTVPHLRGPYSTEPPVNRPLTCRFRGNTLVEISDVLAPSAITYLNRPAKFAGNKAPMKKTTRYVAPVKLVW